MRDCLSLDRGSSPRISAFTPEAMAANRFPKPKDRVRFFTGVQKRVKHKR